MVIRKATKSDIEWVRYNLHPTYKDDFEFPTLEFAQDCVVIEIDDKIVAFACIRNILEGIMMLHHNLADRDRIQILDELIPMQRMLIERAGHESSHAFITDENYMKVLTKHYGYKETKGKCLYLRIES